MNGEKLTASKVETDDEDIHDRELFEVFLTRHGKALYRSHPEMLQSATPEARMDPTKAPTPDLDPRHQVEVRHAAEILLEKLNPAMDELFFVSSSLPRAIETADIFRKVAHERGFTVTNHGDNARNEYANSIAGNEIRILNNLKVDVENLVTLSVFHTDVDSQNINWEGVNEETKEKWNEARAIIEADDTKNWGENFVKHSDAVAKIFPDIGRAKESYERQFKNLLRLAKFAAKRSKEVGSQKNIKVMAFGHENYVRPFLAEHFGSPDYDNVETIKIDVDQDTDEVFVERRGETRSVASVPSTAGEDDMKE